MKHFVGLDASLKAMAVCMVDDHRQRIWDGSVVSSADAITEAIRQRVPDLVRAGMETGPQAVLALVCSAGRGDRG